MASPRRWTIDQEAIIRDYAQFVKWGWLTQWAATNQAKQDIGNRFYIWRTYDSVRNKLRREMGLIK